MAHRAHWRSGGAACRSELQTKSYIESAKSRYHGAMTTIPLPRGDVATPALILDRAALERNVAAMAAFAAERGVALRPHAKTHKSAEIARRQIAAGAVGICCAKLG